MIKHAIATRAKLQSDVAFTKRSSGLYNLLLMVVYYIKVGTDKDNSVKGKPAKFAFPLMSRTNFGSIYKSLPKADRALFRQMVHDKRNGLIPTLGLTRKTRLLAEGHAGGKGPTVYAWLAGITRGRDVLSGAGFSAAMGRFRVEDETKSQKGLVRFEGRHHRR